MNELVLYQQDFKKRNLSKKKTVAPSFVESSVCLSVNLQCVCDSTALCDNEFSGEERRQRGCEDLGFTIHSNPESQYDPFVASLSDQLETDYCVLTVVANTRIQNGFTGYEGLSGAT